jgi:CobQ-like glutamine amidotransferase family enzyme
MSAVRRRSGPAVSIGLLLPDLLGTYADGGNAHVLAQRLRWRGIPAEVVEVGLDAAPPLTCDLYVLGGGEDGAQRVAAAWLGRHRRLRTVLQEVPCLAVCAGVQVLGRWTEDAAGRRTPGAEVLDVTTVAGPRRAVGETVVDAPGLGALTGFENHLGRTTRGPDLDPLGTVRRGTGNGDGTDGVLTATAVGTYLHGPVLARNPALADLLLRRATGLAALAPLEVPDEEAVRRLRLLARGRRPLRPLLGRRRSA